MATQLFQSVRSAFATNVDEASGTIRGVSVITEGPALGHGLMVDSTTVQQIKKCAEEYAGGLKVLMNHGAGADGIVGYLNGFRIDGKQLRADLNLLKSAPHRAYVIELAQTIPDTFGLSVAFSGVSEVKDGKAFARCTEIFSCDLVSSPAANPDGLFSRRFDEWEKNKGNNPQSKTIKMNEDILAKIGEMIDAKLAAVVSTFDAKLAEISKQSTVACSQIAEATKLSADAADKAALAAIKEFSKTLGAPAAAVVAPSAPAAAAPAAKSFEQIVAEHPKYATQKGTAISESIKNFSAEYKDYLSRVQSGKIITL